MTNPPFGGEEEAGIQLNFPGVAARQRDRAAVHAVLLRSLKPADAAAWWCPMVFYSATGFRRGSRTTAANFDLHTIVRLPEGVFAPYTGIPTNVLFFARTQPTTDIWFYMKFPARDGVKIH
ncbi:N-6 DNA methylase [Candidatus Villigracilis vicinus]|uniref:N-6 DNA methylase n=1 Tax=Candidatus Villigracilis vicinus TaxID=3140679 RepID=UPI0031EFD646